MRLKYILTGILVSASLMTHGHPLHLTFTNLEYKNRSDRWEMTIKVFSDDFTTSLKMATGEELVANSENMEQTEKILGSWIEKNILIWFDKNLVSFSTWRFGGIKVKDDATWIKYTFKAPKPVFEIKIRNAFLFDLYADQKNMLVLAMGEFQSAHEFLTGYEESVIKLNK